MNEITMGASGELFGVAIPAMDVSATAIFNVKTETMRNVFRFQTDASDVDVVDGTDTLYYVKMDQWPSTGILNPVHAMMDHSDSENPIATGDSNGTYVDNRMLVKHDFVRYLALKLFNTYQGVDLFSNEDLMKEDLAAKGAAAWQNDISTNLHSADSASPMNNGDSTNNFSRQLLEQIINNDRDRLISDASAGTIDASNEIQAIPLVDGDTISFKVTLKAATGQHNLTGVSAIGDRTYKIKLILGSGTNTAPTDKINNGADDSAHKDSYYVDGKGGVSKADARPALN